MPSAARASFCDDGELPVKPSFIYDLALHQDDAAFTYAFRLQTLLTCARPLPGAYGRPEANNN